MDNPLTDYLTWAKTNLGPNVTYVQVGRYYVTPDQPAPKGWNVYASFRTDDGKGATGGATGHGDTCEAALRDLTDSYHLELERAKLRPQNTVTVPLSEEDRLPLTLYDHGIVMLARARGKLNDLRHETEREFLAAIRKNHPEIADVKLNPLCMEQVDESGKVVALVLEKIQ